MLFSFLIRFGKALFVIFIIGAGASLFAIESTFNGGFEFSIKALALPVGLAVFSFTYINREALAVYSLRRWQPWLIAACFYLLSLLFGWRYVMIINALFEGPDPIVYSGPVIEKFVTHGKSTSYHVRIRDLKSGESVAFNLTSTAYSNVEVGAPYCAAFGRGLFGIPFRWRYASNSAFEAVCANRRVSTPPR